MKQKIWIMMFQEDTYDAERYFNGAYSSAELAYASMCNEVMEQYGIYHVPELRENVQRQEFYFEGYATYEIFPTEID